MRAEHTVEAIRNVKPAAVIVAIALGLVLVSALLAPAEAQTSRTSRATGPDPRIGRDIGVDRELPREPRPDTEHCGDYGSIEQTLRGGTSWKMCWHVDPRTGLVLEKVAVRPPGEDDYLMVLDSAALAQLNVPYDSGQNQWNDITSYGLGGRYTQTMTPQECPGGRLRSAWTGYQDVVKPVLCLQQQDAGIAYRSMTGNSSGTGPLYTAIGEELVVSMISKIDWYEYVTEWRFSDNGQISASLGATGDLAPSDYTINDYGWPIGVGEGTDASTNHYHSAFWKLDWNIGGEGGEKVEQYDTVDTGEMGRRARILKTEKTEITEEASLSTANRRWWRVVSATSKNADGHARSYELELGANDVYEPNPETTPDVSFTEYRPCEKFASFNQDPECSATSIPEYVADGETLTDPVMWVRVGFHHVPRDEDQSPMPMHWQGFDLVPRDFTAQSMLTPETRRYVNGRVGRPTS